MKLVTLLLLIICASFMITMIETAICKDAIIYDNPKLPLTIDLSRIKFGKGFYPTKSIVINAIFITWADDFVVNLVEDGVMEKTADIPFQFNPRNTVLGRLIRYEVVRNNWSKDKGWGTKETSGGIPFEGGDKFTLEFVAAPNNTIIINVNNKHFANFSRVDLSKISQLYISGINTIQLNTLTLCPNQVVTTVQPTTTTKHIETAICKDPIIYNNPKLPLTIDLTKTKFGKGFLPDKSILINVTFIKWENDFVVNLFEDGVMEKTADIPFHFNPRNTANPPKLYFQVVRNNWSKDKGWGTKETSPGFPFTRNKPYIVEFVAAPYNTIIIKVNDKRFYTFARVDLSKITQLYIAGINTIQLHTLTLCPNQVVTTVQPTTPTKPITTIAPTTLFQYCHKQPVIRDLKIPSVINLVAQGLDRGFAPPQRIIVYGTPIIIPGPIRFEFNFADDGKIYDTANTLLHFNPRFYENRVVRDTWIKGKGWIKQETVGGFPFTLGQPFVLDFQAAWGNQIAVFVNERHFVNFGRYDLRGVSQLEIKGAIKVQYLIMCN